jgi:zinc transport system substrate-binding protein
MRIKNWIPGVAVSLLIGLAISVVPGLVHAEKLTVVTTLFPLYDWAKIIGGAQAEVTLLLPPGVESHSFEPKPQDVVRISKSDLFIYTGQYMEPWAEGLLKGISHASLKVVDSSQGIELSDEGPHHEEAEHPFEWAGAFQLAAGRYTYSFEHGPEPSMQLVLLPTAEASVGGIEAVEERAAAVFAGEATPVSSGTDLRPAEVLYTLELSDHAPVFTIDIAEEGGYAFFTEHFPEEFHAQLKAGNQPINPIAVESAGEHGHHHGHGHDHHEHGHHGHDHHGHGGKDPHIWLEFNFAAKMIDSITAGFIVKDPANQELYQARASAYQKQLRDLDSRYEKALSQCRHRTIIYGGHFAFGYFAERFGLKNVSPYQGFAPNAEPTPRDLAVLTDTIREGGYKFIFYEEGIDPKIARVISQETSTEMLLLHGVHNVSKDEIAAQTSYFSLMEDNLDRLQKGLECQ